MFWALLPCVGGAKDSLPMHAQQSTLYAKHASLHWYKLTIDIYIYIFIQAGGVPLTQPIMWHNEETVGRRDAPSSSSPHQDVLQVKLSLVE